MLVDAGAVLMDGSHLCPFTFAVKRLPLSVCAYMITSGCGWYDADPDRSQSLDLVDHLTSAKIYSFHGDRKPTSERAWILRLLLYAGSRMYVSMRPILETASGTSKCVDTMSASTEALHYSRNPQTLLWSCRATLRKILFRGCHQTSIVSRVAALELPTYLVNYVLLQNEIQAITTG